MTKDETLKLALEALESCNWVDDGGYGHAEYDHVSTNKAITAIREALAQPEQPRCDHQESVPMMVCKRCLSLTGMPEQEQRCYCGNIYRLGVVHREHTFCDEHPRKPLLDKEIDRVIKKLPRGFNGWMSDWDLYDFTRAIETKHGIKEG